MTLHPPPVNPTLGAWDALTEVVHAVRLPERFRRRKPRPEGKQPTHTVEWLDDDRAQSLRALLDPALRDAARRSRADGRPRPMIASRDSLRASKPAVFERLVDLAEHPEHLLAVDVDDAVWCFDRSESGCLEQWSKLVLTPEAGFAARVGDVMLHGGPVAPGPGSSNVFIGGRPALRSCDGHVCLRAELGPHAGGGFVATQTKVKFNGFPALRVGDYVDEGPHGFNPIAIGCPSVVIGPTPRPVVGWCSTGTKPSPRPAGLPFSWRRIEPEPSERKEILGLVLDGPRARAQGVARPTRLWAEATREDDRR
ncbi:PAAR domain-containing protein [Paraliomyxa miuraensis]|uniref:PAAR domain-containing protein n=1 Tax=Paraliomyxa miuraensis TaxID=376150 RepID=UPI0022573537|nr:PAAR domain-containing protein [Paraliomyxa miuraensis]MCX4239628.1 PAAR domain-containing protein [Paraliomyxa miuraensis]